MADAPITTHGFVLPELVIESIIRDGLLNVKADLTIIDNVFAQLTRSYNSQKYGTSEIAKIKNLITVKNIAVVYSYHEVDAKAPCISIMLGSDNEDKSRAHLGDEYGQIEQDLSAEELAEIVKVPSVTITSYDAKSGQCLVEDDADLSQIYIGTVYVDASANEWPIVGGINNVAGQKQFLLAKNVNTDVNVPGFLDLSEPGKIQSQLDFAEYEVKGVTGDQTLILGVHAKDALTCKYLYVLLKYFILSRKADLIKRDFYLASWNGSDFNKDQQFLGDQLYSRFLTVMGKADDTWIADQVVLVDDVEVNAVPGDTVQDD